MKRKRTIPINLEDWLKSFSPSLDNYPFPDEVTADEEEQRHPAEQEAIKWLSVDAQSDKGVQSFFV